MADRGEAFVREVDEELRKDQLLQIGQRYGVLLLIVAALALAGIGGFKFWQHKQIATAQKAGHDFEAAIKLAADGKPEEAFSAFGKLASAGPEGYATLSRLRVAGGLAAAGKTKEALSELDSLSGDAKADPVLKDFATLQSALLRMDTADWTDIQNRLSPLSSSVTSPWRSAAREALAIAAIKAGKPAEARKLLEQILGDGKAQASLAERAQLLLGVLTDQEGAKEAVKTEAKPQAPVAPAADNAKPGDTSSAPAEATPKKE